MRIESIIEHAKQIGATDIHIIAGAGIGFRMGGKLLHSASLEGLTYRNEPIKPIEIEELVMSMLQPKQVEALQFNKQLVLACSLPTVGRFRMAVSLQRGSLNVSIKIVHAAVEQLQDMTFHPVVEQLYQLKEGLVLIAGGARSGKSTTAAFILHGINERMSRSIVTIENPIEYLFRHGQSLVKQKEVSIDVVNHLEGLRSTLREDADVIYLDQVPDLQTMELMLNAAEQGHLVIASLYAKDTLSVMEMLIEAFPADLRHRIRMQVSKVLKAIVVQQMVYDDRTKANHIAHEVMLNNSAVKRLIVENKLNQIPQAMMSYKELGMVSMEESLKTMVQSNQIDKETAYHHANDPKRFIEILNHA